MTSTTSATKDEKKKLADAKAAEAQAKNEAKDPAEIPAAKTVQASGAMIEPAALEAVDLEHPAVDANPRAHTTVAQNRIDFNDPTLTDGEAVRQQLDAQG